MIMDLSTLIVTLCITIVIFLITNLHQRKKRDLGEVSLIPFTLIQIIAIVVFVVLAAHLISTATGITFPRRHLF